MPESSGITQNPGSPWAWLPLGILLSTSVTWYFSREFDLVIEPYVLVPLLIGWLASRFGPKVFGLLLLIGLLSAFKLDFAPFDLLYIGFGIPAWIYCLAICSAVAFSQPSFPDFRGCISQDRWRLTKWLFPIALWFAVFKSRGWNLNISESLDIRTNPGFVLLIILLGVSIDWAAAVNRFRSLALASNRKRFSVAVGGLLALLLLAFIFYVAWPPEASYGALQIGYGFIGGYSLVVTLAFLLPAFRLVDWRLMIAILIVFTASDIAVAWIIDSLAAAFPAEQVGPASSGVSDDGSVLEEIIVVGEPIFRSRWLPDMAYGICAALLGAALAPFWNEQDPTALRPQRTAIFLFLVLGVVFFTLPTHSFGIGGTTSIIMGCVAYLTGLVWRIRGIIVGPVIIQLVFLLSMAVFRADYDHEAAANVLANIGLVTFPFAFLGFLSNRYAPKNSEPKGSLLGVN